MSFYALSDSNVALTVLLMNIPARIVTHSLYLNGYYIEDMGISLSCTELCPNNLHSRMT